MTSTTATTTNASAAAAAVSTMDETNSNSNSSDTTLQPSNVGTTTSTTTNNGSSRNNALLLVSQNARIHWTKTLLEEWQVDKEFVLTALKHSLTLPDKSDFERKLPQSLRFDKDVVLAFCQRDDFYDLYKSRHLFVPGCLTNDKDVMLAYCQKIPRSLQECSEELCDSEEIVHAAISSSVKGGGGLELQYASLRLQEDLDTVIQACQSNGSALAFCPPGKTRDVLVHDRDFMLNTVLANPGGGPMWKLLAPSLKEDDEELLLMALRHGLLLRDVPNEYRTSLEFLIRAVQVNPSLYLELPKNWRTNEELSIQAILSPTSTPEIHIHAIQQCPHLQQNRNVILQIAKQGSLEYLQELVESSTTTTSNNNNNNHHNNNNNNTSFPYSDDLEVMKLIIQRDIKFLSHASRRLQRMPEIILVSITPASAWNTLKVVPWSIQRRHPEIPTRAVQVSLYRNLRYLPSHIPDDLWRRNRDLGVAWIRRGGRILNRNVILQIAKQGSLDDLQELVESSITTTTSNNNNNHDNNNTNFPYSDDLEVMTLIIQRDSKFLSHASIRLQHMPEIILVSITPASAWNTLKVVPWSIQRRHPEIPTRAVQVSLYRNLRYLPSHIPDDLWTHNRDLCVAWIRRGGQILDSIEQRLQLGDRLLALEVAKYNWSEFNRVSEDLLQDRDFIVQALEQNGRILRFAHESITRDVNVQIAAVAYHPVQATSGGSGGSGAAGMASTTTTTDSGSLAYTFRGICNLSELQEHVQMKLDLHSSFVLDFLRGIAISPHPNVAPNLRSQLIMLDRGVETSQAFRELIANYLGVPTGRHLKLLRMAFGTLLLEHESTTTTIRNTTIGVNSQAAERPENEAAVAAAAAARERQRQLQHQRQHPRGLLDLAMAAAGVVNHHHHHNIDENENDDHPPRRRRREPGHGYHEYRRRQRMIRAATAAGAAAAGGHRPDRRRPDRRLFLILDHHNNGLLPDEMMMEDRDLEMELLENLSLHSSL
eukprot:scaffold2115_cov97-Cylindrotheca_fusiformis.AAC.2